MEPNSLIGRTLGQYQILDELGRGGMAVVYKAWQSSLRRYIALKVMSPHLLNDSEFVQRSQQEAVVAVNLNHTNIVTIYEVAQQDGYFFISMEYVEGQSLEQLIIAEGGLSIERTIHLLRQVADALDYAHKRKFVHRDIKPANILITPEDKVIISDFGIAKALEGSGATAKLTSSGTVKRSPAYMSPEQILGQHIDYHTDLYSLGVVTYEMLSGRAPFGGTTTALLYAQVNTPPPSIAQLNPRLPCHIEPCLMRMLAKDPAQRFPTATAFVEALAKGDDRIAPAFQPGQTVAVGGGASWNGTSVLPPSPNAYPKTVGLDSPGAGPQPAYPGYAYPQAQGTPAMAQKAYPSAASPPWPQEPSAPVKKKRVLWPWLLGGGLILGLMAALVVLGYLYLLGRETPANLLEQGNTALAAQDYETAREAFEKVLEKEPDNVAAYRGLGWTLYETGLYEQAETSFESALGLAPDDLEAQQGKGRSAYAAGRYEAAVESLQFWSERAVNDVEAHRLTGWTFYQLQLYPEAIEAFSRSVALEGNPEVYEALGDCHLALGDGEAAVAAYQKWAELAPNDAASHRAVGEMLNALRRYDEAVESFSRSLKLEEDPRAYEGWGNAYLAQNEYEQALSQYQQAVRLDANVATSHSGVGWCLFRLQRHSEAIEAFKRSVAIEGSAFAYQGLGNSYSALEEHELALAANRNWLALAPDSAWSHKAVGVSLARLRRHQEATEVYTACVQLGGTPGVVDCYAGLGDAHLALENYTQALSAYLEWVERSPNSIGANSKVGAAYIGLGDCDSARPYLEKALTIDPDYQYANNLLKQCP